MGLIRLMLKTIPFVAVFAAGYYFGNIDEKGNSQIFENQCERVGILEYYNPKLVYNNKLVQTQNNSVLNGDLYGN